MRYLSKNNFWKINKDYNIDKLLYLLIDRPDKKLCINNIVQLFWRNDFNSEHRDYDLPAYISATGNYSNYVCDGIVWYKHGLMHRDKGPAEILPYSGIKQYYINGVFIKSDK